MLITTGVLGSGYILYKLYEAHQQRLADLEREAARERHNDEVIKSQLRTVKTAVYTPNTHSLTPTFRCNTLCFFSDPLIP